jgi:hypothetical protein
MGGSAGKMYSPNLDRGIEKKTKITPNQISKKRTAARRFSVAWLSAGVLVLTSLAMAQA